MFDGEFSHRGNSNKSGEGAFHLLRFSSAYLICSKDWDQGFKPRSHHALRQR